MVHPPEIEPAGSKHMLRARWTLLSMHGSSLIVVVVVMALLAGNRGAPFVAEATPSPTPSPITGAQPTPSISPSPTVSGREQQQQFRSYVSTVTVDGSGLLAAMIQLHNCNGNRDACRQALNQTSTAVNGFETDLDKTSAPPCLGDVDTQLRSGLAFFDRGLAIVKDGGNTKDQLKVVQGTILIAVGTWKVGVAMRRARQSSC